MTTEDANNILYWTSF